MKILTIDDFVTIHRIVANACEVIGVETIGARNGDEGLDILAKDHQDIKLVILDFNMPGKNGIEVLQEIRKNSQYDAIKVIMLTSESSAVNVKRALECGAQGYLVKPFPKKI